MTTEGTTPSTPPDSNVPKPIYKRWWFITAAVIVGLVILGGLFGDEGQDSPVAAESTTNVSADTSTSQEAEQTDTTQATTTTEAPATTTTAAPTTTSTTIPPGPQPAFGSGIQVVGEDVQPGIYETGVLGEGFFEGCYWERLSGFSGDFEELIANNNVVVHDVVEVMSSDAGFNSDCEAWYELAPLDTLLASIPQGKWVVGVHIEAGTYEAEGGDGCYWERLSGVSGEFDDLIANDLPTGSAIVEISPSDYAFNSTGCGEWTLRE